LLAAQACITGLDPHNHHRACPHGLLNSLTCVRNKHSFICELPKGAQQWRVPQRVFSVRCGNQLCGYLALVRGSLKRTTRELVWLRSCFESTGACAVVLRPPAACVLGTCSVSFSSELCGRADAFLAAIQSQLGMHTVP
jgi:hypothetical protein